MRRFVSAVVSAIEGAAIAVAGFAVIAIPALLVWIVTFELAAEPRTVAAASGAIWLIAHGAPATLTLSPETALSFGFVPEALSFEYSLIPLGLTLVTVGLATRVGARQKGGFQNGWPAVAGATVGFAAAAVGANFLAGDFVPGELWLATLVPTLFFAVPAWLVLFVRYREEVSLAVRRYTQPPELLYRMLRVVPRAGALATALSAALVTFAGIAFAVSLVLSYAETTRLSQQLQLDLVGVLALFLLQLAYLPTLVVWTLSWLSGAGFAIGTGSSATPFEMLLGPVPALPVFGAIPSGWQEWGFLPLVVVVLVAFAIGYAFAGRPEFREPSLPATLAAGLLAAMLVGLAAALAAVLASGAIGPGRFAEVGAPTWWFAGAIAAECAVGVLAGFALRRFDAGQLPRLGASQGPGRAKISGQDQARETEFSASERDILARLTEARPTDADAWFRRKDRRETEPEESKTTASAPEEAESVPVEPNPGSEPELDEDALLREYSWDPNSVDGKPPVT